MPSKREALEEEALAAIESGRLAPDRLLALALGSPAFRSKLTAELRRARRVPKRIVEVRRDAQPRPKEIDALVAQAREMWLERPGVLSVDWGLHYRGRVPTHQAGLIVTVKTKKRRMGSAQMLPKEVELRTKFGTRRVAVDVQALDRIKKHALQMMPGDRAELRVAGNVGTLSGFCSAQGDLYTAFLSGHVAASLGNVVTVGDGPGVTLGPVSWHQDSALMDAAAVRGVSPEIALQLGGVLRNVAHVGVDVVGTQLRVECTQQQARVATVVQTEAVAEFEGRTMFGLVRLDREASLAGDSGAPALDSMNRIVGFVVGTGAQHSTYLIPARRVIEEEQK